MNSRTARAAIQLSYQVECDEAFLQRNRPANHRHLASASGTRLWKITLSADALRIDQEDAAGQMAHVDLSGGPCVLIDHSRKEYLELHESPRLLKEVIEPTARATTRLSPSLRTLTVGGRTIHLNHADVLHPDLLMEAWYVAEPIAPSAATTLFWRLLLAGATDELDNLGPPAELLIRDDDDPTRLGVHVKLVDLQEHNDNLSLPARPRGYRAVTRRLVQRRPVPSRRATEPAARRSRPARRRSTSPEAMLASGLLASPPDFAWVIRQSGLDQVKSILNAISSAFGTFRGDSARGTQPPHLTINWWQQLFHHLRFLEGRVNQRDNVVRLLGALLVANKVHNNQKLVGLDPRRETVYEIQVLQAGGNLPKKLARLSTWFDLATRQALADAELKTITAPTIAKFQDELYWDKHSDWIYVRLWDIDTELSINGEPVIEQLELQDGRIRLTFNLPHVRLDCNFLTKPDGIWGTICSVTSGGACALELTNAGYAAGIISDIHLVIDFSPAARSNGTMVLAGSVNTGESTMNVATELLGYNLTQDIAAAIIAPLEELIGFARDRLLGQLGPRLGAFLQSYAWPTIWTAQSGPGGMRAESIQFRPDLGSFGGVLADRPDLGPPSRSGGTPGSPGADGYQLSARYLTAWLHEVVGPVARETIAPSLPDELHVTLPDPATLPGQPSADPLPSDSPGCPPRPAVAPLSYENSTRLVRALPVVIPVASAPNGQADSIGFQMNYQVLVAAIRTQDILELIKYSVPFGPICFWRHGAKEVVLKTYLNVGVIIEGAVQVEFSTDFKKGLPPIRLIGVVDRPGNLALTASATVGSNDLGIDDNTVITAAKSLCLQDARKVLATLPPKNGTDPFGDPPILELGGGPAAGALGISHILDIVGLKGTELDGLFDLIDLHQPSGSATIPTYTIQDGNVFWSVVLSQNFREHIK